MNGRTTPQFWVRLVFCWAAHDLLLSKTIERKFQGGNFIRMWLFSVIWWQIGIRRSFIGIRSLVMVDRRGSEAIRHTYIPRCHFHYQISSFFQCFFSWFLPNLSVLCCYIRTESHTRTRHAAPSTTDRAQNYKVYMLVLQSFIIDHSTGLVVCLQWFYRI